MERAFTTGNASREDVLKDAEKLDLDLGLIEELLNEDTEAEDEDDDEALFAMINEKRG